MNLINGAEVQDPAGVLRYGLHFVVINWLVRLLQVVPLFKKDDEIIIRRG